MNKSTLYAALAVAAFAAFAQPPDVKMHPADPPDNRMPPPAQDPLKPMPPQPVESERAQRPVNTFDALDTNRDGFLTRVEFSVNDPAAANEFDRYDSDRDGKLSKEEWLRSQSPLNKER
jgi:hypothetical protein